MSKKFFAFDRSEPSLRVHLLIYVGAKAKGKATSLPDGFTEN